MDQDVNPKIQEQKAPEPKAQGPAPDRDSLPIKGRFQRYNSPFLELMIPLLTTRYLWLAIEDLNPMNFLKKPNPAMKPGFTPWESPSVRGYLSRNFAALGMGGTLLGILAYYSKNTYEDIRTLYAEAVGYELGKKTEDVTWKDIFTQSGNDALEVTRGAFIRRTLARGAAVGSFFVPWHMLRDFKNAKPKYDANANAGVGVLGVYLSMDGLLRKSTFFDEEQDLVLNAINRGGVSNNLMVQPRNIQTLLYLQRKHMNDGYRWPDAGTQESRDQSLLTARIAHLLNETYHNAEADERANFTIGKFNYLVGFGLLDKSPLALGYVEMANKSTDMRDVIETAAQIKAGKDPAQAFKDHGIDLAHLPTKETATLLAVSGPEEKKFTDRLQTRDKTPEAAKSYQDRVSQASGQPLPPF